MLLFSCHGRTYCELRSKFHTCKVTGGSENNCIIQTSHHTHSPCEGRLNGCVMKNMAPMSSASLTYLDNSVKGLRNLLRTDFTFCVLVHTCIYVRFRDTYCMPLLKVPGQSTEKRGGASILTEFPSIATNS